MNMSPEKLKIELERIDHKYSVPFLLILHERDQVSTQELVDFLGNYYKVKDCAEKLKKWDIIKAEKKGLKKVYSLTDTGIELTEDLLDFIEKFYKLAEIGENVDAEDRG